MELTHHTVTRDMGIMDMAVVVETDGETKEWQIRTWKAHRSAASNRKEFYETLKDIRTLQLVGIATISEPRQLQYTFKLSTE